MIKIRNILVGWGRRLGIIRTPIDVQILSKERLSMCGKCVYAKHMKLLEIINGKDEYVNTLMCTGCGCPCLEKSLVREEKCPLNKWIR